MHSPKMAAKKTNPAPPTMSASEMVQRSSSGVVQLTVKVDPRVVDELDGLIDEARHQTGLPATRTDVLRLALVRGISSLRVDYLTRKRGG
ncbi:MAG TPA: hypothetical protein VGI39_34295 [Polyangiaceae bacterium]